MTTCTITEAAAILRRYNSWRRGNLDRQPMPDPREIGEAIDAAVEMIDHLDALRAEIAAMKRQEPVAWARKLGLDLPSTGCVTDLKYRPSDIPESSYIPLYLAPGAQPAPSFADAAYQGAMEEVAIWKRRALEAEDLNRKFIAEINGPMHMGEPAQNVRQVLVGR